MTRQFDQRLLNYLAPYDPGIANLALALREIVLEEAPEAIESLVTGYAVAIGFSFTGKPLKDGFCHVVTYKNCVNLGFNRGALLADPDRVLEGTGKLIRHLRIHNRDELDRSLIRRFLRAAIEQVSDPSKQGASAKTTERSNFEGSVQPSSQADWFATPQTTEVAILKAERAAGRVNWSEIESDCVKLTRAVPSRRAPRTAEQVENCWGRSQF